MKLDDAQQAAVTQIYETGEAYVIGQMGSGKTIVALTAANELLREGVVKRVLVVAPLAVCRDVWVNEASKWPHITYPVANAALGSAARRLRVLEDSSRIVCINFDNLAWLCEQDMAESFDMLVIDEVTKLKAGGVGFKALRKRLDQFEVRVGLTGTPVSEGFEQLFYCMMAVDMGRAFGKNKTQFMYKYFLHLDEYTWELMPDAPAKIASRINNTIVVLPDYGHTLPPLNEVVIDIDMPGEVMDYYNQFKRDSINLDVVADNAAVLVGKLSQVASGFVYGDDGKTVSLHVEKISRVIASIDGPTVIVYQYAEDLIRLKSTFPGGRVLSEENLANWRNELFKVLFIHPKAAAHGLDLTHSHNMIIYSPIWSSDLTRQCIARIWRRGQTEECNVWIMVMNKTIEVEMVSREHEKQGFHGVLKQHLSRKGVSHDPLAVN